jgi:spore germination protein GerM
MRIAKAFVSISTLICMTLIMISSAAPAAAKGQRRKLVKVYFYHEQGEYIDLSPVKRSVSLVSPARAAIEALLGGPTAEEQRRGFDGLASASDFRIGSLTIKNGTARINFVARKTWAGFPGDTAPIRFKKAVELTLKQFPSVRNVIVMLNGDSNFDGD